MVWLRVPYFLLNQRNACRQDQNSQAHRQQDFPSHLHELVKAISRERATIPDIEVHESGDFCREPENVLHSQAYCGNKQGKTNQAEEHSETSKADSLNAEERMLRHTHCVVEAHCRKKKKRNAGEK